MSKEFQSSWLRVKMKNSAKMPSVDDSIEIVQSYIQSCKQVFSDTPPNNEAIPMSPRTPTRRFLHPNDEFASSSRPRRTNFSSNFNHASGEPTVLFKDFCETPLSSIQSSPSMAICCTPQGKNEFDLPILMKAKEIFEFPTESNKAIITKVRCTPAWCVITHNSPYARRWLCNFSF